MLDFDDLKELFQQQELDEEKKLKIEYQRLKNAQIKQKLKNEKPPPIIDNKQKNNDIVFLVSVIISMLAIVLQAIVFIALI